jgi:uncharacterized protein YfiM (DUF2279 family)
VRVRFFIIGLLFLTLARLGVVGQNNCLNYSDTLHKKRFTGVLVGQGGVSLGSLLVLNEVWYKPYPRVTFQTFNDNAEWLQMDKVGHMMTAAYLGQIGVETFKWAGVSHKKAAIYGSSVGLLYLTGLELLDGTSAQWGFSWGDMAANALGYAITGVQTYFWDEQRIKLKFSAHLSPYAQYRPNVLGATVPERLLKDYNGQTYWMSANLKSLWFKGHDQFPAWLNVAIGYSAEEMISGTPDASFCDGNPLCDEYQRYRQWFLSVDADLSKINYKRKWVHAIFGTFGFIKIPAPTLEWNKHGLRGYWFYF